jgi:hypothetical protein
MSPLGTLALAVAIAVLVATVLRILFPQPMEATLRPLRSWLRGRSRIATGLAVAVVAANWVYQLVRH